jgi:hypothetical protein
MDACIDAFQQGIINEYVPELNDLIVQYQTAMSDIERGVYVGDITELENSLKEATDRLACIVADWNRTGQDDPEN